MRSLSHFSVIVGLLRSLNRELDAGVSRHRDHEHAAEHDELDPDAEEVAVGEGRGEADGLPESEVGEGRFLLVMEHESHECFSKRYRIKYIFNHRYVSGS